MMLEVIRKYMDALISMRASILHVLMAIIVTCTGEPARESPVAEECLRAAQPSEPMLDTESP